MIRILIKLFLIFSIIAFGNSCISSVKNLQTNISCIGKVTDNTIQSGLVAQINLETRIFNIDDTEILKSHVGPSGGKCDWQSSNPEVLRIDTTEEGVTSLTAISKGGSILTLKYSLPTGEMAKESLEIMVIDIDLDIVGTEEQEEETVGGFLSLNSNQSSVKEINIRADPIPDSSSLKLSALSGGEKIRIWLDPEKTEQIYIPYIFDAKHIPDKLFIEGLETTAHSREVVLRLNMKSVLGETHDDINLSIIELDLDVDSDRDGIIDNTMDEYKEDHWTDQRGAIFMVNYDNDSADHKRNPDSIDFAEGGYPISEDFYINGLKDSLDITELVIRVNGINPEDLTSVTLRTPELDQIRGVHVFRKIEPGEKSFWGGPSEQEEYSNITDLIIAKFNTTLGIEGLFFRNTQSQAYGGTFQEGYDGILELELSATGPGNVSLGFDRVQLKVAPLILLPNTQQALQIWGKSQSLEDFRLSLQDTVSLNSYYTGGDQWTQDHIEIGYTHAPGKPKTHIVLRLPRSKLTTEKIEDDTPTWPKSNLIGPNIGLFRFENFQIHDGLNAGDFGGNIEVIPPTKSWPLGRIVVGNTISQKLLHFLKDQELQSPFTIETSWLRVGHVDEIISIIPDNKKWTIIAPDPIGAKTIIDELDENAVFFADGKVSTGIHLAASSHSSDTILVDSENTDFTKPIWEYAKYIRIYAGTGAGQVARIAAAGPGWLSIDKVWNTPTKIADKGYDGPKKSATSVNGQIDSISEPPRVKWFEIPDHTSQYVLASNTRFWLDTIGSEIPAIISAYEIQTDLLLHQLNFAAEKKINMVVSTISKSIEEKIDVIRVPDLLMGTFDSKTNSIEQVFPFAPALTNLQTAGKYIFFGKNYGPKNHAGENIMRKNFVDLIPGIPRSIDSWDNYHRWTGNIHCFTYVKRTPYQLSWWNTWQKY